jgi:hypothetical protein
MYVKQACAFDCATKTVTLRLQPRFVKVTNEMLACLSVQDLLREFDKQAFQISVLLPHATQIGPKRLAVVCTAAAIECTFFTANYRSFAPEINLSINLPRFECRNADYHGKNKS